MQPTDRGSYTDHLQSLWNEQLARFTRLLDSYDDEQLNWKPSAREWSVAECLYHVNVSNKGYLARVRQVVDAREREGSPPFRYGWFSRWFLASVSPGARPVSTFKALYPPDAEASRSQLDCARLRSSLERSTAEYLELIEKSEGLDLSKIRIRSPFLKLVRLPLGIVYEAMGQHSIRHALQAERVTEHPSFPRS